MCDAAHAGDVGEPGSFQTISGIPTGTQCTVSEPSPPTPPEGYTWGTPTFSPSATVTIAVKNATVEVTTNNTLSRDTGKITVVKKFVGAPDGSKATLQIKSGATVAQSGSVADGGSISKVVTTGTYGVDETSAQGDVNLDLYDSSVVCKNGESTISENAAGSARASRSQRVTTSRARSRTPGRPARSRSRRPCRPPRAART